MVHGTLEGQYIVMRAAEKRHVRMAKLGSRTLDQTPKLPLKPKPSLILPIPNRRFRSTSPNRTVPLHERIPMVLPRMNPRLSIVTVRSQKEGTQNRSMQVMSDLVQSLAGVRYVLTKVARISLIECN